MRQRLEFAMSRPCLTKPQFLFEKHKTRIAYSISSVSSALENSLYKKQIALVNSASKLDALSPLKVLARGFSAVTKENKPITAKELKCDDDVAIIFHDGTAEAKIISVEKRG